MTLDNSKIFTYFFFRATRLDDELGFSTLDLCQLAKSTPRVQKLVLKMASEGYQFAGDTTNSSKANTDFMKKRIFINRNKTVKEALLSLMYELTNASNTPKFKNIFEEYIHKRPKSDENAKKFAESILLVESDAVYERSMLAIELNLEHLILEKKYSKIIKDHINDTRKDAVVEELHQRMIKKGRVHGGKKKAMKHYISMYFKEIQKAYQHSA